MSGKYLSVDREAYFPNLKRGEYYLTSLETSEYNCIAWAAQDMKHWWWPVNSTGAYWPAGLALEETVNGFVQAYTTVGYQVCQQQNRAHEVGVEKIAIYVDADGTPTHAARQLPDGAWTSKLGEWEDIRHQTLEAMEDKDGLGLGYGTVAMIMRRTMIVGDVTSSFSDP